MSLLSFCLPTSVYDSFEYYEDAKAPTDRVTIDGITGYQSYEYLLP